jgi:HJR/Mrr/RecB family endonuclease
MISGSPVCRQCLPAESVCEPKSTTQTAGSNYSRQKAGVPDRPAARSIPAKVTLADLDTVEAELRKMRAVIAERERPWRLARRAEGAVRRGLTSAEFRLKLGRALKVLDAAMARTLTTFGAILIAATVGGAIGFSIAYSADATTAVTLASALFGGAVVSCPLLLAEIWRPNIDHLVSERSRKSEALNGAVAVRVRYETDLLESRRSFGEAYDHQSKLLAVFHSRKNRILNSNWESMTGTTFELFLRDVFEELGYCVDVTGQSGDEGADLVVIAGGRRIAIQAKGYTSNTVGSKAVQEVHAGMSCKNCHASAVVTNSTFTRNARAMAAKLNCILVDRGELRRIIQGQARL